MPASQQHQTSGMRGGSDVSVCGWAGNSNALQQVTANAARRCLVGLVGVEPTTLPLSGARSGQVSYRPKRNADGRRSRGPERRPSAVARRGSGFVPTGKVAHRHLVYPSGSPWRFGCADVEPARGRVLMILRKEVIQPHLPIRLPCYDLVPLTGFTLNALVRRGFGCPRLGWLDGRCVQGSGTYSPQCS